ncbi:hypothetical protein [Bradyrhizobium sp. WSM1417]|uniref:AbiU2 domain-containing protein n=1 Tax=Bradyrhizobium sp. WSM1417 TaxID=754500 RepID=UPI0012EB9B40|nr:hypothetical protein [Bradyrhizobium sp. WSM1417]
MRDDQISMLMPEFTEAFGSEDDKALARELLLITREIRVLLGQLFLYRAMSRSKRFVDACNHSTAAEGANIVVATLLRSMIISTAALFDEDRRAASLRRTLTAALRPDRSEFLQLLHARNGSAELAGISAQRLVKYSRALRRGKLGEAIATLAELRNTAIAHFDLQPKITGRRAMIHDIDHVISAASIVAGEANVWVLARKVDGPALRHILRKDATGFVGVLQNGLSTE